MLRHPDDVVGGDAGLAERQLEARQLLDMTPNALGQEHLLRNQMLVLHLSPPAAHQLVLTAKGTIHHGQ